MNSNKRMSALYLLRDKGIGLEWRYSSKEGSKWLELSDTALLRYDHEYRETPKPLSEIITGYLSHVHRKLNDGDMLEAAKIGAAWALETEWEGGEL